MGDGRAVMADSFWTWDEAVPLRWLLVDESGAGHADVAVAACADIEGLFVDESVPAGVLGSVAPPARLLGCRPEPPLRRAVDALSRGDHQPGGARHRRRVNASIYSVGADGTATRLAGGGSLQASVFAARRSTLAEGLLDVTFDATVADPMPAGARQIWELWHAGGPMSPGGWAGYGRELRQQWSAATLAHHRYRIPDRPVGNTYHLDGRDITGVEGFYCAIGEAINGPGGYFGWNADALHDCLRGGWGAAAPFTLVWHHAAVAEAHLLPGRDRCGEADEHGFEQLLRWLAEDGVQVTLR